MQPRRLVGTAIVLSLATLHCSSAPSEAETPPPAGSAAPGPSGAATSVAPSSPGATASFECQRTKDPVSVTYAKGCTHDDDCEVAEQPTCCGAVHEVGAHKGEGKRFASACPACPALACEYGPAMADDGQASKDFAKKSDVTVACVAGTCQTRITK